jgi:hypothetical protein
MSRAARETWGQRTSKGVMTPSKCSGCEESATRKMVGALPVRIVSSEAFGSIGVVGQTPKPYSSIAVRTSIANLASRSSA